MEYEPLPEREGAHRPVPGPRESPRRRSSLVTWATPVLAALVLGVAAGVVVAAVIHMPRVESVADFVPGQITEVYDRNGGIFATYARERRVLLREGEVPEVVQQAVLAAEDSNFLKHGGVDATGVLRAAVRNLRQGRKAQGGSTITMQLARQLFLSPEKTWRRKIEEALLAVELEKRFSKDQILTLYCNIVNVGHGNYGMEAASRYYFAKPAAELTIPEAAMLAGIIQRPSRYSPYREPELVRQRRDYVLRRMYEEGFVSREEYEGAVAQPLRAVTHRPESHLAPYFAEEVRQYLESRYGSAALLERGLRAETTLDRRIQRAAEASFRQGLVRLDHRKGWRGPLYHLEGEGLEDQELPSWSALDLVPGAWNEGIVLASDRRRARVKLGERVFDLTPQGIEWTGRRQPRQLLRRGDVAWFRLEAPEEGGEPHLILEQEPELDGAVIVLESATGAMRAMVGGWDFERSKFNRATQARRQVGSAFKPFVYGAALEVGYTPADTLFDGPVVFPGAEGDPTYSPRNYHRKYFGTLTLRRALEHSVNVTSVKLLDLVGVERVVDFTRRCGITSNLPPYPSLALGSADLVPLELAAAFATFANQGIYVEPYLVERVSLPGGQVLEEHVPAARKALEPPVAYVLTRLLEGVIDRGTGFRLADLEIDLAGKTGTTDDYTDAWFVGYTPRYTILVWVGYDVKRKIGPNMTGSEAALPVWRSLIERGLQDGWLEPEGRFVPPPEVVFRRVDYETGLLATPASPRAIEETFVEGTEPARTYEPRWARVLELPWYQQQSFYIPKEGERMPEDVADWEVVRQAWAEE